MINIFHGKDDFSAHEAVAALKDELSSDGGLSDNTDRVDGARAKPGELLALCQTMPFLAEHRLIVVAGLLQRFEAAGRPGRKKRKSGEESEGVLGPWQPFVDGLHPLPDSTTLVFLDGSITARNPMLAALRPLAQVREFPALKQHEVAGWINQRAQQYGLDLHGKAIATLAVLVGNQLWTLDAELRKLATYAAGQTVTESDVRSLVSLAREPNVFAMADAVIEGRDKDAAELLQRLLSDGESPLRLLAMIARQYRLLILAKELLEQRVRPTEISAKLRVQGFVIQRLLKQAPIYTIDRLRRAYRRLLEADLSIKRGVYDDETALHLLIAELAALSRATLPAGRSGYSRPSDGRSSAPPAAAMGSSGRR